MEEIFELEGKGAFPVMPVTILGTETSSPSFSDGPGTHLSSHVLTLGIIRLAVCEDFMKLFLTVLHARPSHLEM